MSFSLLCLCCSRHDNQSQFNLLFSTLALLFVHPLTHSLLTFLNDFSHKLRPGTSSSAASLSVSRTHCSSSSSSSCEPSKCEISISVTTAALIPLSVFGFGIDFSISTAENFPPSHKALTHKRPACTRAFSHTFSLASGFSPHQCSNFHCDCGQITGPNTAAVPIFVTFRHIPVGRLIPSLFSRILR